MDRVREGLTYAAEGNVNYWGGQNVIVRKHVRFVGPHPLVQVKGSLVLYIGQQSEKRTANVLNNRFEPRTEQQLTEYIGVAVMIKGKSAPFMTSQGLFLGGHCPPPHSTIYDLVTLCSIPLWPVVVTTA